MPATRITLNRGPSDSGPWTIVGAAGVFHDITLPDPQPSDAGLTDPGFLTLYAAWDAKLYATLYELFVGREKQWWMVDLPPAPRIAWNGFIQTLSPASKPIVVTIRASGIAKVLK